jgi:peptide/nickel transport system substrate-binding protein
MDRYRGISRALASAALLLGVLLGAQTASAQPKAGGTLRFVMKYEPPTLAAINNSSTPTTSPKIFDGLVTYDDNLKPLPQLATSWEVSPDGLEYRFQLRDGVKWHDGKPFTSADVAFSILRLKQAHLRGWSTFVETGSRHLLPGKTLADIHRLTREAMHESGFVTYA